MFYKYQYDPWQENGIFITSSCGVKAETGTAMRGKIAFCVKFCIKRRDNQNALKYRIFNEEI